MYCQSICGADSHSCTPASFWPCMAGMGQPAGLNVPVATASATHLVHCCVAHLDRGKEGIVVIRSQHRSRHQHHQRSGCVAAVGRRRCTQGMRGRHAGGERRRRQQWRVAAQACKWLDHFPTLCENSLCTRTGSCCGFGASATAGEPSVACIAPPVAVVTGRTALGR